MWLFKACAHESAYMSKKGRWIRQSLVEDCPKPKECLKRGNLKGRHLGKAVIFSYGCKFHVKS